MSMFRNLLMQQRGWTGKPADWQDIRKDCPANSIALYAGQSTIFTKVGNPTIENGVVSGFSNSNYLTVQESITFNGALDINISFTNSNIPTTGHADYQTIFRLTGNSSEILSMVASDTSSRIVIYYRPTNGSLKNYSIPFTTFAKHNTRINISDDKIYIYGDNTLYKEDDFIISVGNILNSITFGSSLAELLDFFGGSIDLNETYIKVNDAYLTNNSSYDNLGFTATCSGGYNVYIDEKKYGTFTSGSQCSITWSKYNPNLPAGYTQVEYATFDGTQQVDTGLNISLNDEIRSKFNGTTVSFVYGADTTNPRVTCYLATSGNQRWGTAAKDNTGIATNSVNTVIQNKTAFTVNGTAYNYPTVSHDFTTVNTLTIGNCNGNSTTAKFSGDFYYMQIYQNGSLAANIIPCKSLDNVVGFYDTVREIFLSPSTGTLVAGNEVYPSITTGDIITTPSLLKAHKIWIEPATEGNNITAFHCDRVASSGTEEQGVLWAHFNLANQISLNTFASNVSNYSEPLFTSVTAKNNKLSVSSLYYAFYNTVLEYIPNFIFPSSFNILLSGAFYNTKIKNITIKDTALTSLEESFYNCQELEKLNFKNVDFSGLTSAHLMLTNAKKLKDTSFDFSAATGLTKLGAYGDSSHFIGGLKGLRVSNEAPFDNATAPQINISYTGMDRNAIVTLFNDLPTVNAGQIINITVCTGSEDLTSAEIQIATDKGWTVTGGPEFITYHAYTNANNNIYSIDDPAEEAVFVLQNLTKQGSVVVSDKGVMSNISRYNYVSITPFPAYTTSFEFVFKVKLSSSSSSAIIGNGNDDYTGGGFVLRTYEGTRLLLWGMYNYSQWDVGAFDTGIDLPINGDWIWVRMTWDGTKYEFWKSNDGIDYSTRTAYFDSTTPFCVPYVSKIGASGDTSFYFRGEIDLSETYYITDGNKTTLGHKEGASILYEKENNSFNEIVPQPEFSVVQPDLINATNYDCTKVADGIYSASSGAVIQSKSSFNFSTANSWELETVYQYKGGGSEPMIWASRAVDFCGAIFLVRSGTLQLFLTDINYDWRYDSIPLGVTIVNNETYHFKLGYNSTDGYYLDYYTESGTHSYTRVWNNTDKYGNQIPLSFKISSNQKCEFLNWRLSYSYYYSSGNIDFSRTKITIDNTTTEFFDNSNGIVISNVLYERNSEGDITV